ncbi:uncharacterized protein LTR77_000244 [Saxophila tyrrhenica]|uniref:Uncharacterized protein n=1 Tax=Saxophila tyrrhenica TaxID=1690608 RepID=A0AAV9PQL8_9PEZI|nr:hypothetical protein LTR77_000244 [Saxophila tyrrhenica]
MSSDSLAVFRKSMSRDLNQLAEEHMQHDLDQSDRDALRAGASTVATHTSIGSLVGIGLGLFLAYRIRAGRTAMFNTFKASERPTAVRFPGGREEPLPDLTPMMKPSVLGDVATYMFLGAGGLFFGGETGLLTGTFRARQQIGGDRGSRERIETAFRRFQADALRKQADALDKREGGAIGL